MSLNKTIIEFQNNYKKFFKYLSQVENYIFNSNKKEIKKPIFISGMARSGTTFTTHLLFSCKEFASLQYKDIPFYKIIIFWSFFSKIYYGFKKPSKRIHGDDLMVSINSPDAFEELIWKNNLNNYLNSGFYEHLDEFYENAILKNDLSNLIKKNLFIKKKNRYLSKNNYNIFRIKYLINQYNDAKFIILYRDPIETVESLVKVHNKFINLGKSNESFGKELELLGHHEFGPKRKAFNIGNNFEKTIYYWSNGLDHNGYLLQWNDLYSYVLKEYKNLIYSKKILLLKFSNNLDQSFCEKIINHCEINNKDQLFNYFKSFVINKKSEDNKVFNYDKKYLDTSQKIFKELNKLSIM